MKFNIHFLLALLAFSALTFSCDPDDPEVENEEELITTLNYVLTPTNGGDVVTLSLVDLDGDGGMDPVVTEGSLTQNTTYNGTIVVLNEAETPVEDITEEVRGEDEEHQFFFQTDVANLSITYDDQDSDQNPVGLATTLTTGAPANGTLTVILRHEPNKAAAGVSDGAIENAGGETDIETVFQISVQ